MGSGGGAAAAPAAGGAAAGGAAAEADAPAAEEKKEGTFILPMAIMVVDKVTWMLMLRREGGVRGRGHGIRPFRLSARLPRRRRQRDEDEGDDDDVSLSVAFGVAEFHCYGSGLNASLSLSIMLAVSSHALPLPVCCAYAYSLTCLCCENASYACVSPLVTFRRLTVLHFRVERLLALLSSTPSSGSPVLSSPLPRHHSIIPLILPRPHHRLREVLWLASCNNSRRARHRSLHRRSQCRAQRRLRYRRHVSTSKPSK